MVPNMGSIPLDKLPGNLRSRYFVVRTEFSNALAELKYIKSVCALYEYSLHGKYSQWYRDYEDSTLNNLIELGWLAQYLHTDNLGYYITIDGSKELAKWI